MARIIFDELKDRHAATGVSNGVIFSRKKNKASAWNGIISVSENPDGADETALYADNKKYGSFRSSENYNATIEAYTYPNDFLSCDGKEEIVPGMYIGQQGRDLFDFSFKSDIVSSSGETIGYLLHIVYNATASPSEMSYQTANDSPDASTFSWDIRTLPFVIKGFKPSSKIVIDSTKVDKMTLKDIESMIYGGDVLDPFIPTPEDLIDLLKRNDVIRPVVDILSSHKHWVWDSFNFKTDNVPAAVEKESLRHIYFNPEEGTVFIQPSIAYTLISENSYGVRHYLFVIIDKKYPSQLASDIEEAMGLEKQGTRTDGEFYYYSYDLYK